jgi:2'-hydroxyisoflavone reductase
MTTSRRSFLAITSGAVAAAALGHRPVAAAGLRPAARRKGLHILILGGTGFLGPACTESALAAGHTVTLFNRGRTEDRRKNAGRPSVIPEGVQVLYGNRDPDKTADDGDKPEAGDKPAPGSPKGLAQLEGKTFDAVIDTSGYWPRMVKASAELLAPNVKQYVFISTLSVYKDNDKPGADESADLATLADPAVEDFGADFSNYGGGKALCEKAAEAAMPGRVTALRPGFIVGPRDTSARFMHWPVRAARGGEFIVPGTPDDPIQVVDVRDLADFTIRCIEQKTVGTFDVTGPAGGMPMKTFVEGIIAGTRDPAPETPAAPVFIDADFLVAQGVPPQAFPLWLPPTGETAGFHRRTIAKATKAGLTFRPLSDTAKATLAWYRSLPEDTQKKIAPPGVPADKEKDVIALWKAAKK